MTTLNHTRPEGIGNLSARLVLEARAGDGANQFATLYDGHYTDYTGYEPINTPDEVCELDRWQPLLVDNKPQQFLVAQWGLVKPFALRIGSRFRPDAPPAAETPEFHEQVKEVIDESANLNDYRKVIAEYWSDGAGTVTPPGHCCQMAHFVARRDDHGSIQDIKLFFVLSNTLFDASIAAWDCKRHHDYVRPITAVRHLYKGKKITAWGGPGEGRTQLFGECWLPYLPTPPFPECVSGHSTFTTAAAEILCRFTGSDEMGDSFTFPKGSSAIEPDITPQKAVTLSWETFSDAACQAGLSRRYGGIHFKGSDEAGQALGRQVAAKVWERACHFFNA